MGVRLLVGVAIVVVVLAGDGCVTTRIDPELYRAERFAIASVYARKDVAFESMRVAPMWSDNEIGAEVVEMELGETEARLGEIFEAEVLPVGKALQQKVYNKLPEAWPPEAWSQVNDMIAVDVDAAATPPLLGELATALNVDAVIVVRHEFSLARDRFEVAEGVTAFDRCTILVVDRKGKTLWDEVVLARVPAMTSWSGAFAVGLQYATWADEARRLSRRAARHALDMLARRHADGKRRERGGARGAGAVPPERSESRSQAFPASAPPGILDDRDSRDDRSPVGPQSLFSNDRADTSNSRRPLS